jgi:hypothetical protein
MSSPGDFTFGRAELETAVAKAVIDRSAADSLAEFLVQNRTAASDPDEERLRLITGFNDIFVTIGIGLFLGALGYLLSSYGGLVSSSSQAIAAWGLAEVFTKRKRMALPSIVLLVVFVVSSAGAVSFLFSPYPTSSTFLDDSGLYDIGMPNISYGLTAVAASVLHWLRFHVPITIAAFAAGLALVAVATIEMLFALAMKFDMSDRNRTTQRTDIAFWLHLLAAPLIVHSVVRPLLAESVLNTGAAIAILSLFAVLSFVALAVDRRALLVSSLLYLGYASSQILTWSGVAFKNLGFSVLIVGGTVLVLSVAWQPLRRVVLSILPPNIRNLVPPAAA